MYLKTWDGIKIHNFSHVSRAVQRAGFPAETQDDILNAVATLYRQKESSYQVAKIVGVSDATIRLWLHRSGYPVRGRGGRRMVGKPVTIQGVTRTWREWFPPESWTLRERQVYYCRIVLQHRTLEAALTTPFRPYRPRRHQKRRGVAERWEEGYDN